MTQRTEGGEVSIVCSRKVPTMQQNQTLREAEGWLWALTGKACPGKGRTRTKSAPPTKGWMAGKNSRKAPVVLGKPGAWGMCGVESEDTALLAARAHTQRDSRVSHSGAPEASNARPHRTRDDQAISVAQPPRIVRGTPGWTEDNTLGPGGLFC